MHIYLAIGDCHEKMIYLYNYLHAYILSGYLFFPSCLNFILFLGALVLDDCDTDTYGLEQAVDFIKGKIFSRHFVGGNLFWSEICLRQNPGRNHVSKGPPV